MKNIFPTLLVLLAVAAPLAAQEHAGWQADPALQARLEQLTAGFGGDVGVYVHHLRTGAGAAIDPDGVYPTASLIKVPILLTLFQQVDDGVLDLSEALPYPDTLNYQYVESTDVVGYMEPGETLPLRQLAFLMLSTSDNVASLWIQALVGGGAAVNEWMAAHGYAETRVNSRTPGREDDRATYGWGQTTPREIAEAFRQIRAGQAVSPAASEDMYRLLTASYWRDRALSQIPPTVQAASKQGFVSRARSDVVLVNAPEGDYVLAVLTKNQEDTTSEPENEGLTLIRDISRMVYAYFNPEDAWRPRERE